MCYSADALLVASSGESFFDGLSIVPFYDAKCSRVFLVIDDIDEKKFRTR